MILREQLNPLRHVHTLRAAQRAPFSFLLRQHCTAFCDFRVKNHRLSHLFWLMSLVQFQRIDTFLIIYHIEAYCSVCIIVHLKCQNINSMRCGCLTHNIMKMTYLSQVDICLRSRCSWSERWYRLYRHCLSWILNYALLRRTNLPIHNKFIISHPIFIKKIRNTEGCLHLQTPTKAGCTR